MILNSGLDAACTVSAQIGSGSSGSEDYPYFCNFIQYAAFGTGSTAPSAEQTSLDAQVGSRSNSRGGFSNSEDGGFDADNNLIWYEATFTRVFSISNAVNAAEWGLSRESSGNLSVRDLFREDPNDPNSDPVTLSLEEGDQLQLVITFRVEAAWEYETKSFEITGTAGNDSNGTHTGNASASAGDSTTAGAARAALVECWPGGGFDTSYGRLIAYLSDQSGVGKNQNFSAGSTADVSMTAEAYTPGNYYRDYVGQFSTSQANGDHYAWRVGRTLGGTSAGYRFILTNPVKLTKSVTHRLTLTQRRALSRL